MRQPQPPSHFLEASGDDESAVSLAGQEAPSVAMTPVDTVTQVRTQTAPRLGATSIKQCALATSSFNQASGGRCRCASST